jgi:probable F420-dependent oxidoreductase
LLTSSINFYSYSIDAVSDGRRSAVIDLVGGPRIDQHSKEQTSMADIDPSRPLAFGLFGLGSHGRSDPETIARVGRAAEAVGFESLWAGEHVVLPDPRTPASPMDPADPIHDPLVVLTFLAAQTRRIRLGTGIVILPQRNPVVLAKQVAGLDVLSSGRFIFGVGAGYLEPEMAAIGVPYNERGARTEEYLAALRALWSDPPRSYAGRFVSFEGVVSRPRPVQRPHPPIVVGGHAPAVLRRAAEQANGWFGWGLDPDQTARAVADLRDAAVRYGRPPELGDLEITVTPPGPVDLALAARYKAAGVHRLILYRWDLAGPALDDFVAQAGETLIGKV